MNAARRKVARFDAVRRCPTWGVDLDQLKDDCEYSEEKDSEVDSLIAYKNAIEDRVGALEVDLDEREGALSHVQNIAYDAVVDAEVEGLHRRCPGLRGLHATLERIVEIAESGKPGPDWGGFETGLRVEPAYAVAGFRSDNHQPYTTTVFTHNGPEAASALAHRAFAEDNDIPLDSEIELEIVAIFKGEPTLVDFDDPCEYRDCGECRDGEEG